MSLAKAEDERSIPTWKGDGTSLEYERWSVLIRCKIAARDLGEVLERAIGSSDTLRLQKQDRRARDIILPKTDKTAFTMIKRMTCAYDMLQKLDSRYGVTPSDEDRMSELFDKWTSLSKFNGHEFANPNLWLEQIDICAQLSLIHI